MKRELGRATMAEQVAWTAHSFPTYSAARQFDAAMDATRSAETERKLNAVIASCLAPDHAEFKRLGIDPDWYDHVALLATPMIHWPGLRASLAPEGLGGVDGCSGATEQGEPGRTIAAACPSLMLQRPTLKAAEALVDGLIDDVCSNLPGAPSLSDTERRELKYRGTLIDAVADPDWRAD